MADTCPECGCELECPVCESGFLTHINEVEGQRIDLAMMLSRALRRMKKYEMDVDCEPPDDHREFLAHAEVLLLKAGFLSPLREE